MYRRTLPLVALLALLPAALQAQSAEERIEAARVRAQSSGVPVALLDSKIAEGKAKGVPMDRIATAIEQRAAALSRAQAAMARGGGRDLSEADLGAGADALGSGISEAVLQTISETAPRERRAVAITALTELVALGHDLEDALQRVTDALERGPEALANLPAQASEARARGGPPAGAAGPPAGVGGRPDGVGGGPAGAGPPGAGQPGPPTGIPAPGGQPGGGNPGAGRPDGAGRP
jgi:hypothetical protein